MTPSPGTPAHALYVLLDSNLPTGGFVASSGLESFAKHGFLTSGRAYGVSGTPDISSARVAAGREWVVGGGSSAPKSAPTMGPSKAGPALAEFAAAEVDNFEASTGAYLSEAWDVAQGVLAAEGEGREEEQMVEEAIRQLVLLDETHESTLLSHVARRASRAQGVALLTLHARGLGPPPGVYDGIYEDREETQEDDARNARAHELVAGYKRAVRRGAPGHLAVCFGVVCSALGIDLDTAHHLYLFTHARSLLSSAVRLNIVGPYLSTQLLAHPLRRTIGKAMQSTAVSAPDTGLARARDGEGEWDGAGEWAWADEAERGPATTWPLGEILAARHDLQHSRIFNS